VGGGELIKKKIKEVKNLHNFFLKTPPSYHFLIIIIYDEILDVPSYLLQIMELFQMGGTGQ
jgi:hypothetical protein